MNDNLLNRFSSTEPKKILSLDGGGIRGALSLGYLKRIESILREKENNPNYVLSDYFDLIGGTSTGAIIATLLALGKSVDEIREMYMELGGEIFAGKRNWWNPLETYRFFKSEFSERSLVKHLKKHVGDITLGSDELKTGLCIVAKRADTNSTWFFFNHPNGMFYKSNKNIPLWQLLRASSAAPSYFIPQSIDIGNGEIGAFVDGGVSMANNPALSLLMIANMKGFPCQWELGEDKLTLISVGTGYTEYHKHSKQIDESWLLSWAKSVPDMLMQDSSWQNQIMLQWLSKSPTAEKIDEEMGDLKDDCLYNKPMLNYLRFNICLSENSLNGLGLKRDFTLRDVKSLAEMSNASNRYLLYEIGEKSGEIEVLEKFFK
ncbi:patatin-like phospholipase family protein [Kaistella sp. G5-32]|uniref:Patatin-like phospholipase family protein n=1 Tax=Kaistella gelatinilytica TaxID=2787636 RepID=A0ABS0FAI9_9FLAO|nr:patatin-like phospholipase family protein [Kaistella gelatinilytica]MBF8456712.1 patatin-like phospholipase family protein [Kaistella gelatinilytica]